MTKDPFGQPLEPKPRINPFGEEESAGGVEGAATRMEQAARKIRQLKTQLGAEGLTLQATRDLIDEISAAVDAGARALRDLNQK
jgi:flagellin-like hook-associated protein FlgL